MARSSASRKSRGEPGRLRPLRERGEQPILSASPEEQRAAVLRPDTPPLAILALARWPRSEPELLEAIASHRRWLGYHDVVRAACFNGRTPLRCSLGLLQRLYALDLVQLLGQVRLAPALRTAAAHLLRTRLEALNAGERLGLARNARGPGAAVLLANETAPQVLGALLENPAVRELDVCRYVSMPTAQPEALALIGRHRRWSRSPAVRGLLVQSPRTPTDVALSLIESLQLRDLEAAASDARIDAVVRLVCRRYLQEKRRLGPFAPEERA